MLTENLVTAELFAVRTKWLIRVKEHMLSQMNSCTVKSCGNKANTYCSCCGPCHGDFFRNVTSVFLLEVEIFASETVKTCGKACPSCDFISKTQKLAKKLIKRYSVEGTLCSF